MRAASETIAETGGYLVGRAAWLAAYASWPFGSLEIRRDRLVLHTITRRYEFPRELIVALSVFRFVVFRGLRIRHSISSVPEFIVFWPLVFSRLQEQLAEAGFPIVEINRPNQALERTATRFAFTFRVTKTFSRRATLAPDGRRSAYSR